MTFLIDIEEISGQNLVMNINHTNLQEVETTQTEYQLKDLYICVGGELVVRRDSSSNINHQKSIITQMGGNVQKIKENIMANIRINKDENITYMHTVSSDSSSGSVLSTKEGLIIKNMAIDGTAKFAFSSGGDVNSILSSGGLNPNSSIREASINDIMKINNVEEMVLSHSDQVPIVMKNLGSVNIGLKKDKTYVNFSVLFGQEIISIEDKSSSAKKKLDAVITYDNTNPDQNFKIVENILGEKRKITLLFKPKTTLNSVALDQNGMSAIVFLYNESGEEIGVPIDQKDYSSPDFDIQVRPISKEDKEFCKELLMLQMREIDTIKKIAAQSCMPEIRKLDIMQKAILSVEIKD